MRARPPTTTPQECLQNTLGAGKQPALSGLEPVEFPVNGLVPMAPYIDAFLTAHREG
jgi:hypothetical protein